ncbi:hypothetical protein FA13DRAFT_1722643 [Coprinellus micaceus]|uniref:Uncharacterized protein n=1 Tax=Coprinellus micaceus TaxID=71717 RepID=A0A4Y7RK03_COPMI|nr:hypothetical protein FA13DRAFT_1722643 [Coprinellus micaceus]
MWGRPLTSRAVALAKTGRVRGGKGVVPSSGALAAPAAGASTTPPHGFYSDRSAADEVPLRIGYHYIVDDFPLTERTPRNGHPLVNHSTCWISCVKETGRGRTMRLIGGGVKRSLESFRPLTRGRGASSDVEASGGQPFFDGKSIKFRQTLTGKHPVVGFHTLPVLRSQACVHLPGTSRWKTFEEFKKAQVKGANVALTQQGGLGEHRRKRWPTLGKGNETGGLNAQKGFGQEVETSASAFSKQMFINYHFSGTGTFRPEFGSHGEGRNRRRVGAYTSDEDLGSRLPVEEVHRTKLLSQERQTKFAGSVSARASTDALSGEGRDMTPNVVDMRTHSEKVVLRVFET